MTKKILIIVLVFQLFSCERNGKKVEFRQKNNNTETIQKPQFLKTDKLIITIFDTNGRKTDQQITITDDSMLDNFELILYKSYNEKYCFQGYKGIYDIRFFDNNSEYKFLKGDTSVYPDTVTIYDFNFQFSHKIPLKSWKLLLKQNKEFELKNSNK